MSIMYCTAHNRRYDSDMILECPQCQDGAVEAAKDEELARVTALKGHWEELANQYMDRIQAGERQLTEVLKDAKWLAEWIVAEVQMTRWKDHYTDAMLEKVCMGNSGYKRAQAFLSRPDVRERQERKLDGYAGGSLNRELDMQDAAREEARQKETP